MINGIKGLLQIQKDYSNIAQDVDTVWNTFVNVFTRILDKRAPWRLMTFSNNLPDWCTTGFLSMCRDRDNMKKKARKTNNPLDIDLARR